MKWEVKIQKQNAFQRSISNLYWNHSNTHRWLHYLIHPTYQHYNSNKESLHTHAQFTRIISCSLEDTLASFSLSTFFFFYFVKIMYACKKNGKLKYLQKKKNAMLTGQLTFLHTIWEKKREIEKEEYWLNTSSKRDRLSIKIVTPAYMYEWSLLIASTTRVCIVCTYTHI